MYVKICFKNGAHAQVIMPIIGYTDVQVWILHID